MSGAKVGQSARLPATTECKPAACTTFDTLLTQRAPILALAPMQDVTDLPFMRIMKHYGGADVYYTEYFRVHADSCLNKTILSSITQNPTGRPVIARARTPAH